MRALTYNIHKGIGGRDRRYRIQRVIDIIEEQNPDIICLQEVDRHVRRSRLDDQPKLFAEYFRSQGAAFQLNVHLKSGGYGNLILSRWGLLEKHNLSLRFNARKPRGAISTVIDTPEGPLHLVNFHLGLSARERRWQVSHLLEHHLFRKSLDKPTLILGDYNDWRNMLAADPMAAHDFHSAASPPSRFRTFPAYLPIGALDKAFYRGGIAVRHVKVVHSRLARDASDHLPLVVDFHLNKT